VSTRGQIIELHQSLQRAAATLMTSSGGHSNAGLIFDLDQYLDGMLDHYAN
jgi:hypothetical protein